VKFLLNQAPPSAHLVVGLIQALELALLPFLLVHLRIQEVNPFFTTLDFRTIKPSFSKVLRNMLPLLRFKLRLKDSQQL
jgi:hypothetical protein